METREQGHHHERELNEGNSKDDKEAPRCQLPVIEGGRG